MADTRSNQPNRSAVQPSQPVQPVPTAPVGEVPSDVQQPGQSPEEKRARIPKPGDEVTYAPNRTGEPQSPAKK